MEQLKDKLMGRSREKTMEKLTEQTKAKLMAFVLVSLLEN